MTLRSTAIIAILFFFHCGIDNAVADYVVIDTDANGVVQGQLIGAQSTLKLQDGERVVLLSESGDLVEMIGPSEGVPTGETLQNFNLRDALRKLIDAPSVLHTSLGSTRIANIPSRADDQRPVWHLDPFKSGIQCTHAGADVQFWRADAEEPLSMVVQRPGVSGGGDIAWPQGEQAAAWPPEVPLADEELYVVRRPGWMESAMIRIVILPETVVQNRQATIAWLAVNGCKRQARTLNDDEH